MRRRNRNKPIGNKYLFLVTFGILLAFLVYLFMFHGSLSVLSPAAYFPTPTPTQVPPNPIQVMVDKQLQGSQGAYAVVVKNLKKTDPAYVYNEHHIFDTASMYKAWVMAVIYEKIEKGQLQEDSVLEADIAQLNKEFGIAPELAEQTSGTTSYTVSDALRKMITISDNYASLLLTHEVTYDGLEFFLMKYKMNDSHTGEGEAVPSTSAYDTALFYENLYRGKLANKEHTKKMIELLKQNEFKTVIPKYIPVPVAHKTGALDDVSHDAGIVFTPKHDYVIVLMSQSGVPPAAEERMARISESVYQYFQTLPEEQKPFKLPAIIGKVLVGGVVLAVCLFLFLYLKKRKRTVRPRIF